MNLLSRITNTIRKFVNYTLDFYVYIVLLFVFIVTGYPFLYISIYSISGPAGVGAGFLLFPRDISFYAFSTVLNNVHVLNSFFISVARSTIGPFLGTTISMMVAYALTHKELPGRRFITMYFVLTMYFSAGMIPMYLLIHSLGLTGSFWVYIFPTLMNVFGMLLMRTYIESLPSALEESAYIDGANEMVIFSRIIVPLSTPVISAIFLLSSVMHWNSYTDTLIYNAAHPELYTLQFVLVQMVTTIASGQSDAALSRLMSDPDSIRISTMTARMAMTVITILPISIVYPVLQKHFIKGILLGAVKG